MKIDSKLKKIDWLIADCKLWRKDSLKEEKIVVDQMIKHKVLEKN
jgi:hypothetical protein